MDTQTVKLTALRPLVGNYGHVTEGQQFEVSPEDAESLEARGLAERYRPPAAPRLRFPDVNSFKQTYPPENKMMPVEAVASKQNNKRR